MAAPQSANAKLQIDAGSVSGALASAALEWMIIIMLLIDAIFSYLITSLAQYFDLEAPCLLRSRLDHVVDKAKHGFYLEKLCRNHKLQLSSLIFCDLHENLVDVHGVCESCLVSFLPLKGQDSLSSEKCACCDKSRARSRPVEMITERTQRSMSLSQVSASDVVRDDGMGKSCTPYNSSVPFCHVRYDKLQNSSDSESDELIPNEMEIKDPVYDTGHAAEGVKKDVQPVPLIVDLIEIPRKSSLPWILDDDNDSKKSKFEHIGERNRSTSFPERLISYHPSPKQSTLADVTFDELNKNKSGDEDHGKNYEAPQQEIGWARTSRIQVVEGRDTQVQDNIELAEAYKLAIGGKGRQSSGKFSEEFSRKGSGSIHEDVKILLSHMSSAKGIELSPHVSANTDQFSVAESSSPCPRNGSGSESMEGSTVSEHEGESLADRLRRQIEHDRKLLNELQRELDEERNASAVAANQALAMITRLQKEKAELHMEALQYLRMMEEQAEYDNQALQDLNDLVVEREKDVRDLEEELAFYRNMFGNRDDAHRLI